MLFEVSWLGQGPAFTQTFPKGTLVREGEAVIAFAHVDASFHKRLPRGETLWPSAVIAGLKWRVQRFVRNADSLKADQCHLDMHKQEDR